MKRPYNRANNHKNATFMKVQQLTPWNQARTQATQIKQYNQMQLMEMDGKQQHMPTYRRNIVQNFLCNIKIKSNACKNRIVRNGNFKHATEKMPNKSLQKINNSKSENSNRNRNEKLLTQGSSQVSAEDASRIIQQEYEKRRKARSRLNVVNIGGDLKFKEKRKQCLREFEENKLNFIHKLRIKEEIINQKNSVRAHKKQRSKTYTNIFKKAYFQFDFSDHERSPSRTKTSIKVLTYCRNSSTQKKSLSQIRSRNAIHFL